MKKNDNVVIAFDQVNFYYDKKEPILSGITFDVKKGETIGIVGANGAGKSTLMKLITGLLMPISGQVEVDDFPVTTKNLKQIRQKVGYTFQDPDNQLFMPSVYEDVAFAARQEGKSDETVKMIVEEALQQVGGMHLVEKASYKMSGGEKRVVTLATVLASKPEVLILDEPAVGLDPRARRQFIRLLASRNETKIIATHDMDMALSLCDRIIVLYKGKIQADDTPMAIFGHKELLCQNHLELPLRMQGCPVCNQ